MKNLFYRGLPLFNVAIKRLGAERNAARSAVEVEICQPEEIEELPLPISLPGQLDLIRNVTKHDTLAQQISLAKQTVVHHAAVMRYTLKDCVVVDHGVEFIAGSMRKHSLRLADMITAPLIEESSAHYCMSPVSHTYFGHFLTDACSNALLNSEGQPLLLDINPAWPHAVQYAEAFCLKPAPQMARFVRRLTVFQDHGQGSNKRARYTELRSRIAQRFGPPGTAAETVFLRRGTDGQARLIAEEDRVAETLEMRGCRIVSVDGSSLKSLADELRYAKTVITVEGSHINHAYFLTPYGLDLCVLMPDDRATFVHRGFSNAFGGRFGYIVCPKGENGYRASVDDILRTLDMFGDAKAIQAGRHQSDSSTCASCDPQEFERS